MPKVTVIIPVYNVEKYIHECLDSVVNQTLTDIQIICVDDGSPDNCPAILDEYAARDARISVIHQKNAGLSAARNVAYPSIKGEYTLFVDSDDWIERDLCEKAVGVADREQADMTCFFMDRYGSIAKFVKKRPFSEVDRITLADDMFFWSKLWRTRFLLDNDIRCPEGMYSEDNFVQWKALLCHPRLALLPEMMYHYRVNLTSTMRGTENKAAWDLPKIYDLIKKMLIETDNYHGEWKEIFLQKKLKALRAPYVHVASHRKAEYLRMVREAVGQDETEYLIHNKTLKRQIAVFYRALLGSRCAAIENAAWLAMRGFNARCNALRYKLKWAA